ncbi:MAG: DUF4332 domain-containing protein [Henriciella sp.]|nr:DUF4332 domain-containing protein [Henriciella sp.]
MTLLELVIVAHRCRSTHHFIAFDALQILKGQDAGDWKNLMLRHHVQLLKGAKAPDTQFKDFQNHVLHVQEGEWGGARDKAMEWYGRAVDALRRKKWSDAAFALGVMTHYYADPVQPFHTGQTEEEGAMHRALEWSIAKSRDTIKAMIDVRGYPTVEAGSETGFVADMVLEGARFSNQYYQTFIDHYDLDRGVKDPEAGLDQTLLDVLADLIAYATAGVATLFERAFAEAGVKPQKIDLDLPGYLAALDIPIRKITKRIADASDRRQVEAMYAELQATGKVIKTLPADDKKIRKLHAKQVLRVPLGALDAQNLKPLGTKHVPRANKDLPARYELKVVPVPVDPAATPAKAKPTTPAPAAVTAKSTAKKAKPDQKDVDAQWAELEAKRLAEQDASQAAEAETARLADEQAEIERKVTEANKAWAERQKRKTEAARRAAEKAEAEEAARLEAEAKAAAEAEAAAKAEREAKDKAEAARRAEEEARAAEAKAKAEQTEKDAAEAKTDDPVAETVLAEIEASVPKDALGSAIASLGGTAKTEEDTSKPAKDGDKTVIKAERRDRLTHDAPVVDAPSIGPKTAERLAKVNIVTIGDLLSADVDETVKALNVRYITAKTMTDWQDQTRLMIEAPGLRVLDSQILVGAGIRNANELAKSSATKVLKAATSFLDTPSGARVLWGAEAKVGEGEVKEWISFAKSARN